MRDLTGGGVNSTFNQSSFPTNQTSCTPVATPAQILFMLVCSLVFLVGLVLNGFTLRVYFCRAQQNSTSSVTIYLKNLAAADFLLSLCLPLRIANYVNNSAQVQHVYCHFGASAFYLNMYASILFMGCIAANRYLKIVHPLRNHILQTVRAAYFISTVTWFILLVSMGTYITLSLLTPRPLTYPLGAMGCTTLQNSRLSLIYKIIHSGSAVVFLCVFLSMVFFYYGTTRQLTLAQQKNLGGGAAGCRKLVRSRRNMVVLVSVFCVCFIPYHVVRLLSIFLSSGCTWGRTFFYLKELTVMLSILNVCLDPLIYFIFSKAFRAQLGLRRVANTTWATTSSLQEARRSSDGQLNVAKTLEKKTSVSMASRQTSIL